MTVESMENLVIELEKNQAISQAEINTINTKIDNLTQTVSVINQLAEDVHMMAANMQTMQETLNITVQRLDANEKAEYTKYVSMKNDVRKTIISGVVGAAVTTVLSILVALATKFSNGGF